MSHLATTYLENVPLLPATVREHTPSSGILFRWIVATLGFGGGAVTEGYFAVISFIAKNSAAGGVFGAGALLCGGACTYCLYRMVTTLHDRAIQPIEEIASGKADSAMLRLVNTKLLLILNETEEIDLGGDVDDSKLHQSITQQLQELEQMLPDLRAQISDLQGTIQTALTKKSVSTPASAYGSPGDLQGGHTFEQGLLTKLEALSQKLSKDQASRNTSRFASRTTSPTTQNSSSSAMTSPHSNGEKEPRTPKTPYKNKE
jgi:hypothetical protein